METEPEPAGMTQSEAVETLSLFLGNITRAMRVGDHGPLNTLADSLRKYDSVPCPLEPVWFLSADDITRL